MVTLSYGPPTVTADSGDLSKSQRIRESPAEVIRDSVASERHIWSTTEIIYAREARREYPTLYKIALKDNSQRRGFVTGSHATFPRGILQAAREFLAKTSLATKIHPLELALDTYHMRSLDISIELYAEGRSILELRPRRPLTAEFLATVREGISSYRDSPAGIIIPLLSNDVKLKVESYRKKTGIDLSNSVNHILSDNSMESYFKAEALLEYSLINDSLWRQFDLGSITFEDMLRASVIQYNNIHRKLAGGISELPSWLPTSESLCRIVTDIDRESSGTDRSAEPFRSNSSKSS